MEKERSKIFQRIFQNEKKKRQIYFRNKLDEYFVCRVCVFDYDLQHDFALFYHINAHMRQTRSKLMH